MKRVLKKSAHLTKAIKVPQTQKGRVTENYFFSSSNSLSKSNEGNK